MDQNKQNQFVDQLLEASLARHSAVAPRPGLEGRVLASTRSARERRTWFMWAGWLAAGAASVAIAVGILNFSRKQGIPSAPKSGEQEKAAIVEEPPSSAVHTFKMRPRAAGRPFIRPEQRGTSERVADGPHLTVFPSPQTATAEEKLMVRYVRETPPSVLSSFRKNSREIPDLEFKDLIIPPLESEEDKAKDN